MALAADLMKPAHGGDFNALLGLPIYIVKVGDAASSYAAVLE